MTRRWARSLRLRLWIGSLALISLALFTTWMVLSSLFAAGEVQEYEREMQAVMDVLAAQLTIAPDGTVTLASEPLDQRFHTPSGGRYWQIAEDGNALIRSRSLWDTALDNALSPAALVADVGPDGAAVSRLAQAWRYETPQGERSFVISVAAATAEIEAETRTFSLRLGVMLAVTAFLLLMASALQISAGLAPLARLRREVSDIRSGRLARLSDGGPGELAPLVAETNALLDERDEVIARARARAADLAHGLKTPLTVLAHIGEQMANRQSARETGLSVLEQVDTVRQRVDRQLALARIRRGPALAAPLAPLVGKIVAALKPLAREKLVDWRIDLADDLVIAADEADLAEAIGNVLDNALSWTGSLVRVSASRVDTRIRLEIADDGPGIPVGQRAFVLGRGGRLDESRGGNGLGLAIAADILDAVGGTISLDVAPEGGLLVVLDWPASAREGQSV